MGIQALTTLLIGESSVEIIEVGVLLKIGGDLYDGGIFFELFLDCQVFLDLQET